MNSRLFVGNLSFNTSEEAIRDAFAEFGEIVEAKLVTDRDTGRSRGFAFVELTSNEAAEKAIQEMNGALLDGRPLRVNLAEARRDSRGGGGGGGGGGFGALPAPTEPYQFVLLCLDRKTGQTKWQKVAREEVPHEGHHRDHGFSSYSPVTDGEHVYAYFGSRGLHCYDMAGNPKWQKDFGRMQTRNGFGEGSSPALFRDTARRGSRAALRAVPAPRRRVVRVLPGRAVGSAAGERARLPRVDPVDRRAVHP